MDTYIAFLRGINVGGKNIIKMDALCSEFESMGFQSVKTFIQSGNVIFKTKISDKEKIEKKIEKSLAENFNFSVKVLVRSIEEIENTISHFPIIFENPDWKHNVIFLTKNIDSKDLLEKFTIKKDIEQNSYFNGVLYWSAKIDSLTKSTMLKLSSRKEYQEMTVRNVNTTKKIFRLMKDIDF
jgi:uncharacterized protein (DUF1697 family)